MDMVTIGNSSDVLLLLPVIQYLGNIIWTKKCLNFCLKQDYERLSGANIMAPFNIDNDLLCVPDVVMVWRRLHNICQTKTLFERVEPGQGYILITRYPASQRILLHCTGKTSSWVLHCAIYLHILQNNHKDHSIRLKLKFNCLH